MRSSVVHVLDLSENTRRHIVSHAVCTRRRDGATYETTLSSYVCLVGLMTHSGDRGRAAGVTGKGTVRSVEGGVRGSGLERVAEDVASEGCADTVPVARVVLGTEVVVGVVLGGSGAWGVGVFVNVSFNTEGSGARGILAEGVLPGAGVPRTVEEGGGTDVESEPG